MYSDFFLVASDKCSKMCVVKAYMQPPFKTVRAHSAHSRITNETGVEAIYQRHGIAFAKVLLSQNVVETCGT